ncbi:MAG: hypothetical protein BAA04_07070 [Firmicutes bacterium ZCTH02-B6]|nr:MAG: hypothetical protein BAA04_07070 [Firmicutes bacterium ZCTH02-B6]
MRVTLTGRIKGAALKPDSVDGKPALDVKLELNVVSAAVMHDLIRVWEQTGARVIVTMEPQQSQLFGDSNGDERMNVFTAGPADGQTSMLAADGENDGDDEDNGDDARDTDGDREDPATDSVEPVPAFTGAGVNVYRRFGAEGTD